MKAIVLEKRNLKLRDIPKPLPTDNEALVMVDGDFPLDRAEEVFALARRPGVMKVLITPHNNKA